MAKDDYEVGHGKPPKDGQIQPCERRNPNGRPPTEAGTLGQEISKEGNRLRRFELDGKKYKMTNREIAVRVMYQDATSDAEGPKAVAAMLRSFSTILKLEGEELDRMLAPATPPGNEPPIECIVAEPAWESHRPVCGKAKYDEIERERKQFLESGRKMQALAYSGPRRDAEQIEEFEIYRKRAGLELADDSLVKSARYKNRKKRRKARDLSYGELLILEGNRRRRVLVDGKMVSKSLREIAAMKLYAKAFGRDSRVRMLIAKFEAQEARRSVRLTSLPNFSLDEVEPILVTLVFDEEPVPGSCDACKRAFYEKRMRTAQPHLSRVF